MARSGNDIRDDFMRFFEERGHTFVPSAPLLPADDPTLLFTNAGMNPFKGIFLATERRDYVRAHNTQKCIRAGGKHNDLEDVGHDVYHHTFFEMLGNWSFGDYFKAEAIGWAWELLTDVWGLPKDRLYATCFEGAGGLDRDQEAADLWQSQTDIDRSHILWGGRKDNFWEMGEAGPCGPCSEIHIDLTADGSGKDLVNAGDPRVIEIWNLVFIQYSRAESGELGPLPARHVDTGMGLERICMVLQGKTSNYATDLFVPMIEKIETLTDHRYGAAAGIDDRFDVAGEDDIGDVACRVIADHARALTFAITDGVMPSNEGRGYVLRRILRRAARYGRQYLGIEGAFLAGLVPTVVDLMAGAFPELTARRDYVIETIRDEEESFGRTLDRGIALFEKEADQLAKTAKTQLPGAVAFDLYATYGFPVDLTQIMAAERDMTVDMPGYEQAMVAHQETSAASAAFKAAEIADLPQTDDSAKYARVPVEATVLGWVHGDRFITDGLLTTGEEAAVVLDKTCFYGEQGGQVGDGGTLTWPNGKFAVIDSQHGGPAVLHVGVVESGELAPGAKVTAAVDTARTDTMRNHTATHLLNWALREVLGDHVNQAGSEVGPDRLRFDFSHKQALTAEQLERVERMVNERVLADESVSAEILSLAEAKKVPGVRAVFGEKYPDPVRMVRMGRLDKLGTGGEAALSAEFCGGTHLERTGQVGLFKMIGEESIAKGVRRITALTGRAAVAHIQQTDRVVAEAARGLKIKPEELPGRIAAMQKEIKQLRKGGAKSGGGGAAFKAVAEVAGGRAGVFEMTGPADANAMRAHCDQQRQKGAGAVFVGGVAGEKVVLVAMVSQELVDAGVMKAGDWVQKIAPVVGGGGGGKPTMAQAGGKDPAKLAEALSAAAAWAQERLA